MKPNATDIAAGWPPLVRDVDGLRVRLKRQCTTGAIVAPPGLEGVLTRSTAWHRLDFRGKGCQCCGVGAIIRGLSRNDLEVIR